MNPTAIYSKSGKGVQEAAGKTSLLSRADRAVLSAFDGRLTVSDVAQKVGKTFDAKFQQLIAQLDKDGFIREVSSGSKAAPKGPAKPAAAAPTEPAPDLDFTQALKLPPRAPAPSPQAPVDLAAKARAGAERRAKEEEAVSYKGRQEVEAKAKAEAETTARAEREARLRAEAEAKARAEAEAKAKAETDAKVRAARDAVVRAAAEAKAKSEAEMQARLEVERKAREEAERAHKEEAEKAKREAEELRRRLEEERQAREAAERRAKEEAERARKEAEEKAKREAEERARREEEERRKREEEERRAKEEAERKAREAEERRRREEEERSRREEDQRRAKQEAERKAREEEERSKRDEEERARAEAERKRREEEDRRRTEEQERRASEEAERKRREEDERKRREDDDRRRRKEEEERVGREAGEKPAAAAGAGLADSLLADLDSFSRRDDEERRAKEEAERKAKEEKERRAQEEAERGAREAQERKRREQEERRRREDEERRAREEEERREREEEEQRAREADERKRAAREALAAKAAEKAPQDDIGVTDEDLDMDDVRRDEQALTKEARRAAREREEQRTRKEEPEIATAAPANLRRPMKWGRPAAIALFVLLVGGVGAIHVMPVSTSDYEKAAGEALGRPVRIASGRLSVITGVQLKLSGVSVGDAKIAEVRAYPAIGSLFGEKKVFGRIELEGVTLPQQALGDALFGAPKGDRFSVQRVVAKQVKLDGPLPLPPLDAELVYAETGALRSATVRGPESLVAKLTPRDAEIEFDVMAGSFAVPFAPEVSLNQFGMKGSATRKAMSIESWGGSTLEGTISGAAKVQWGASWSVDGALTVRGINAAVFAPALLSEGKAEGSGRFSYSGAEPAKLAAGVRVEGNFTIAKGALGSFDLSRAIQTGGRQASGRTQFAELSAQGVYDRGAVSLRNVTIGAGALNAGASADIASSGALTGRIVADVRTANQTLRATLNLGGTVKEPQVK
ncbi:MAG: hypothetical protein A3D95_06545 [Betaproteobacteria bacterium RIFCSPHIGHO2_12_FULL_69_13]|nr:MAG: hypothetical protein A3D95_06545 [Betaproteobacteria bacterium RIFCSPHIGHO2_12_FULL_69_13]